MFFCSRHYRYVVPPGLEIGPLRSSMGEGERDEIKLDKRQEAGLTLLTSSIRPQWQHHDAIHAYTPESKHGFDFLRQQYCPAA